MAYDRRPASLASSPHHFRSLVSGARRQVVLHRPPLASQNHPPSRLPCDTLREALTDDTDAEGYLLQTQQWDALGRLSGQVLAREAQPGKQGPHG
ncbi:hypothetical protein SFB10_4833 [Serratia liquefaciens]|nr:hypothetical protein SFB10_4833 [Serratia liquefaciens]